MHPKLLLGLLSTALLVGALTAAGPDQPAPIPKAVKPVRTYRDVLTALPKDLGLENAHKWNDAQKEVANGILKQKLVDTQRPMKMRFKVFGVDHWGRFTVWGALPADELYTVRVFAGEWKEPNTLPKLASLRQGDIIEMTGVCDLAKFENLWNTPSLSLGIAKASFIKLLPSGKPAPPPATVPVKVISAVYGSGTQFTDVTDRVKALLAEPGAIFYANPPWLGADPTPGWNKSLIIVHEARDKRHTFTSGENGEVTALRIIEQASALQPKT